MSIPMLVVAAIEKLGLQDVELPSKAIVEAVCRTFPGTNPQSVLPSDYISGAPGSNYTVLERTATGHYRLLPKDARTKVSRGRSRESGKAVLDAILAKVTESKAVSKPDAKQDAKQSK